MSSEKHPNTTEIKKIIMKSCCEYYFDYEEISEKYQKILEFVKEIKNSLKRFPDVKEHHVRDSVIYHEIVGYSINLLKEIGEIE